MYRLSRNEGPNIYSYLASNVRFNLFSLYIKQKINYNKNCMVLIDLNARDIALTSGAYYIKILSPHNCTEKEYN
jgi:transposase